MVVAGRAPLYIAARLRVRGAVHAANVALPLAPACALHAPQRLELACMRTPAPRIAATSGTYARPMRAGEAGRAQKQSGGARMRHFMFFCCTFGALLVHF